MNLPSSLPAIAACAGLASCMSIAALAGAINAFGNSTALGWLPLAMLLGILAGNLWPAIAGHCKEGVDFARGALMRTGIALYGLSIGVNELWQMGWSAPLMALLIVASTLLLSMYLGQRLGLERHCALLIGAGSAICGAAAIVAAQGVIAARPRHVSAAVASIVVFGMLGMYLLPALYPLINTSAHAFGLWIGLTVHELGHVVAAGHAIGAEAAASAVLEKMLRVLLLAPAVLCIGVFDGRGGGRQSMPKVPLFIWGFGAALAVNASGLLPSWLHSSGNMLAQALLAVGLVAVGLSTRWSEIRDAGLRVWLLAAALWLHLLISGFLIVSLFA